MHGLSWSTDHGGFVVSRTPPRAVCPVRVSVLQTIPGLCTCLTRDNEWGIML